MSSLRSLDLDFICDESILDGCTFKLDSLTCFSKSLRKNLNSQPSLTKLIIWDDEEPLPLLDERCLPNLTRVTAMHSELGKLIPGRPVREVYILPHSTVDSTIDSTDLSFFTFSTTPIELLWIRYDMLYPKPTSLLVSIFPSLVHLVVMAYKVDWIVRVPLRLSN